jgi:hypothetical protein
MAEEVEDLLPWNSFLALLASATLRSPTDSLLWRMTKPDRVVDCRVREVRSRHFAVGLELRVEHNGQVFLTELHRERVAFDRRVEELRAMLEAEGWTLTE